MSVAQTQEASHQTIISAPNNIKNESGLDTRSVEGAEEEHQLINREESQRASGRRRGLRLTCRGSTTCRHRAESDQPAHDVCNGLAHWLGIDLGIGVEFDALAFLVPELISKQLKVGLDVGCPPP